VTNSSARKFQKDLNSGVLALVLLATLARSDEDLYGYEIAKRLRESRNERDGADASFAEGSLYPVLRSLSAAGWLTSRIVPSYSGPPRRYYRVTPAGREALAEWLRRWQHTRDFVEVCTAGIPARILEA